VTDSQADTDGRRDTTKLKGAVCRKRLQRYVIRDASGTASYLLQVLKKKNFFCIPFSLSFRIYPIKSGECLSPISEFNVHRSVHRNNILVYNSNKMHKSQSLFYLTTALHVSGVAITHLQKHKATVTTPSGNRYTVIDRVKFTDKKCTDRLD
jgi:hypothetical protein